MVRHPCRRKLWVFDTIYMCQKTGHLLVCVIPTVNWLDETFQQLVRSLRLRGYASVWANLSYSWRMTSVPYTRSNFRTEKWASAVF